jgi:hypothetical protein
MAAADKAQGGTNSLREQRHWSRRRKELAQWFDERVPSFVIGYEGAVELLYKPTFPGRVHFVCHAVRDIYRFLPSAIGMEALPRPAEIFPGLVKELADIWQSFPPTTVARDALVGTDVPISSQVHACAAKIVKKRIEIGEQPTIGKQLAIALFRSSERGKDDFIAPWIIKAFDEEYKFFVSRAHLARSVPGIPSDEGLIKHFESFETAFHSLVGPYFSGKKELDDILQETNKRSD